MISQFLKVYGLQSIGLGVVAFLVVQRLSRADSLRGLFGVFRRRKKIHPKFKGSIRRSGSGDFRYFVVEEDEYASVTDPRGGNTPGLNRLSSPRPISRQIKALGLEQPLVIAMVGLPARGKSYLVKMIIRYLRWCGNECEVFNVGSLRRNKGMASVDSNFFSSENQSAKQLREKLAVEVQDAMYDWIHNSPDNSRIGIFDATNTTKKRRLSLANRAREENAGILFIESICDDQSVLQKNYDLKLANDDYKGMDPIAALRDFKERVAAYERVYEAIDDEEINEQISYIKIVNVGQKIITRNCSGYTASEISFFLQNVHVHPRRIYLTLTGESVQEATGLSSSGSGGGGGGGGSRGLTRKDSFLAGESFPLSSSGNRYAEWLGRFMENVEKSQPECKNLLVLSGTQQVHVETVLHLRSNHPCYSTPLLNELRGGDYQGFSQETIARLFPEEHAKRERDRLNYRYPGVGGESYVDVIDRVKPVIIELERQRRTVVVCAHIAVLRCIYAYFMGSRLEEVPFLPFKPHTLYELSTNPFGSTCKQVS